jgi:hypothetical protein
MKNTYQFFYAGIIALLLAGCYGNPPEQKKQEKNPDFEVFIKKIPTLPLPLLPSDLALQAHKGAIISPEKLLQYKIWEAKDSVFVVGKIIENKKMTAIIFRRKDKSEISYKLLTYSNSGKKISELLLAVYNPPYLQTAEITNNQRIYTVQGRVKKFYLLGDNGVIGFQRQDTIAQKN